MSLWKPVELALTGGARLAWPVFQAVNRRFEGQVVPAAVVCGAAHEEPRAVQSVARVAANDRLALSLLRA